MSLKYVGIVYLLKSYCVSYIAHKSKYIYRMYLLFYTNCAMMIIGGELNGKISFVSKI